MRYYLYDDDDDGGKYIEDEDGEKTRVHLIYCEDLESAKKLGSELVQCIPKFVGFIYPAFQLNGQGLLALAIREDSLDSLLSDSAKGVRLFNGNQMSPLYKTVIKSLLIVTDSLLKVKRRCNFDRSKIFIVEKDLSLHVEVVDFTETDENNTSLLVELREFVKNINEELGKFGYRADIDVGMKFLLGRMEEAENIDFSKIAELPVFWDWVMVKNLICKVRRLCNTKYENHDMMKQVCKESLEGWEEKVGEDADLGPLLDLYLKSVQQHTNKTKEALLGDDQRFIQFLAAIIKHFNLKKTSNIPSVPAALQKTEEVLGEGFHGFIER